MVFRYLGGHVAVVALRSAAVAAVLPNQIGSIAGLLVPTKSQPIAGFALSALHMNEEHGRRKPAGPTALSSGAVVVVVAAVRLAVVQVYLDHRQLVVNSTMLS